MRRGRGAVIRTASLLAGCGLAVCGAWVLTQDLLRPVALPLLSGRWSAVRDISFEQHLDAACAALLLGCVVWVALGTVLAVASYASAELFPASRAATALGSLARHGCPRALRRLVLAALGVAVGVGAAGPALAGTPVAEDRPVARHTAAVEGVTGLALPDRTTGIRTRPRTTLVRPGDSLWSIASGLLPPDASDATVTRAWHRLHRANQARVGPDPDLIHPGTRLVVPDHLAPDREEPS